MKKVKARKGPLLAIAFEGDKEIYSIAYEVVEVPKAPELFTPFVLIIPLQIFAYYCALELRCDVDQPRNLAKSVAVE